MDIEQNGGVWGQSVCPAIGWLLSRAERLLCLTFVVTTSSSFGMKPDQLLDLRSADLELANGEKVFRHALGNSMKAFYKVQQPLHRVQYILPPLIEDINDNKSTKSKLFTISA